MDPVTCGSVETRQPTTPPKTNEEELKKDPPVTEDIPAVESKPLSSELAESKKTLESNRPGSTPIVTPSDTAKPKTDSNLTDELTKKVWGFFGSTEPESKLETPKTSDASSQLTDSAKLSLRLMGALTGPGLTTQLDSLMLPKNASDSMIDIASVAISNLVTNYPGSKANLLDSYLGSLEKIRQENSNHKDSSLSTEELKNNHKQIIGTLVAFQLPEDKNNLADIAAELLIHSQDQKDTKNNERQDLIQGLIDASSGSKDINYGEIIKKVDASLSHLSQGDLAAVYSNLIEKGINATGLADEAKSSLKGLDLTDKEIEKLQDTSIKALSTTLGDIFSRLEGEGKQDVLNLASDLFKPGNEEKLSSLLKDPTSLFSNPTNFGLSQEKLDSAEIALANAGLNFLKDKINLNQKEVDQISNLYKLSKELAGKDGVFNNDDVATLAATLGVNDLTTLKNAKSMIQDQIMGTISQEAYKEAERQIKADPSFSRVSELLSAPGRIRDGIEQYNSGRSQRNAGANQLYQGIQKRNKHPIIADIFFNARSKIAQGRSELAHADSRLASGENQIFSGINEYNQGVSKLESGKQQAISLAQEAINLLGSQVNEIINPLTRAGASIEVSKELRQQLQKDPSQKLKEPSPEETKAALNFFKELSAKPLSQIDSAVIEDATKHHENLTTQALRNHLESGIDRDTRKLSDQTKDTFKGIEKFLSIAANKDIRSGITQENLKAAKDSSTVIDGLINKFEKAYNFDTNVNAQGMMKKFKDGELSLAELPKILKDQVNQSKANLTLDIASKILNKEANKEFFEAYGKGDASAADQLSQRGIAGFKIGDKEYLGYTTQDNSGKTRIALADQVGDKIHCQYIDSNPQLLAQYKNALAKDKGEEIPNQKEVVSLKQNDAETQNFIKDFVQRGFIRKEEAEDPTKQFRVFEHQGQKFLGMNDHYNSPSGKQNRPAYITVDGTRMGISGHVTKLAAYNAALAAQPQDTNNQNDVTNTTNKNSKEQLKIDESLFRDKGLSFSQEMASKFLSKENNADYHDAISKGRFDDANKILSDRKIAGFRMNGNDYMGFITANGEPAYQSQNEKGEIKAFYIQDETMKSAFYGALMRDGTDISGIDAFSKISQQGLSQANEINNGPRSNLAQPLSGPGSFDSLPKNTGPIIAEKDNSGYIHSNIQGGSSTNSNRSNSYNQNYSNQSSNSPRARRSGYNIKPTYYGNRRRN